MHRTFFVDNHSILVFVYNNPVQKDFFFADTFKTLAGVGRVRNGHRV